MRAHSFEYVAQADSLVGKAVCSLKLMTVGEMYQIPFSLPALSNTAPALSYGIKALWAMEGIDLQTVRHVKYPTRTTDPCDLYPTVISTENELQPLTIRNFIGACADAPYRRGWWMGARAGAHGAQQT